MQVTCPNCRARYAVDPLAIGPSGRIVQCARCDERWFQVVKVEPKPESVAPQPEPAHIREPATEPATGRRVFDIFAPKPRPQPAPNRLASGTGPDVTLAERASIDSSPMPQPVPDVVIRPERREAMLPALIEPKADRGISLLLVGTFVLLLLLAAGVIAFHDVIVDQLPVEWRTILRFNS
jgi:predicted Zn finger-like uncharacterized protein